MEDTPQTFLERMTSLGVDRAVVIGQERVRYAQPHEPLFSGDKIWAKNAGEIEAFKAWGPDLVVFDACAESMSLEGKSISNNDDVTDWITKVIRPWTHVGAAVLVIDHLPKSDENRNDRYPIGGQHKLPGLDGSAIRTNMVRKFGRNMGSTNEVLRGVVRLTVTKDRSGGVRGPIIQNGGDDPDAAGELVLDIQSNGAIGAFIREADASQLERKVHIRRRGHQGCDHGPKRGGRIKRQRGVRCADFGAFLVEARQGKGEGVPRTRGCEGVDLRRRRSPQRKALQHEQIVRLELTPRFQSIGWNTSAKATGPEWNSPLGSSPLAVFAPE